MFACTQAQSLLPFLVLQQGMAALQAPVFRQLYSEKQVVAEERRARVDNSPMGPYLEGFVQVSSCCVRQLCCILQPQQ